MPNPTLDYRTRIYRDYAKEKYGYSAVFDERAARKWAVASDIRRKLSGFLPAQNTAPLLELGCGGGNFLYFLKFMGYEDITGVDLSPDQCRLARQVTPQVFCGDALEFLSSPGSPFGMIVALDLIEHFTKDEFIRFLGLCRSRLADGGVLVLKTPNAESPWGGMHRYHDFTHEIGFDPHSLKHMLGINGFEPIRLWEDGPSVHGARSLVRWLLWRLIHALLALWNVAETGTAGSGIYTRNFFAISRKKEGALPEG